jgi:hypothetical protein
LSAASRVAIPARVTLSWLGFDEVQLHQVGRNQRAFVEAFGERVLPALWR